jgi:multiple sugar transport system permease protein
MEFGYAAALALILTLLLLTVVWLYVRRASRDLDR